MNVEVYGKIGYTFQVWEDHPAPACKVTIEDMSGQIVIIHTCIGDLIRLKEQLERLLPAKEATTK